MRGSQKEYWFGILGCLGVLLLLSRSVGVSARPLKELEKAKQEAPENHRRPVANFEVEAQTRVGSSSSRRVLAATALSTTDDQVANPSSASRHDVDSVDSASPTEETSGHCRSGNGEFCDSSKYRKYSQSEKQKVVLSLSSTNNYAKASCSSTGCNNGGDRMNRLSPLAPSSSSSGSTSHRHGSTKTRTPNSTSCRRLLRQTDNPSQKTSSGTASQNTEVGATRENNFRKQEQEQEQRDDSCQIFSIAVGFREAMDEARMEGVVLLVLLAFCLRDIGRAVQKPWILQLRYFLETAAIYVLASQLIPTSWIPLSYFIIAFIFLLFGGIKRT